MVCKAFILKACPNFPRSKPLREASTNASPETPSNRSGSVPESSRSSHRPTSSPRRLRASGSSGCTARASTSCSIWRERRGRCGPHHGQRKADAHSRPDAASRVSTSVGCSCAVDRPSRHDRAHRGLRTCGRGRKAHSPDREARLRGANCGLSIRGCLASSAFMLEASILAEWSRWR